jgi:FkbM family methyltransferase
MNDAIKNKIRPLILPSLHRWQRFYDLSRGKWREFSFRGAWVDLQDRREALKQATPILEDAHGMRFVLYPWDRPNLRNLLRHPYDIAEFKAIPHLVKFGDTAFDIGANVGVYSVLLSRLCGPTGRVWAFEPVPDTYWRLRETLVLNRCENVVPLATAICDKSGSVKMNLFDAQFAEWNSLGTPSMRAPDGNPVLPGQSIDVEGQTLDQFCEAEGVERINFLKVDVEGFEVAVFRGAERLLRDRRVDYLCFEISKEPLKGAGVESRDVFRSLETHGYASYRFDGATGKFQGPVQDTAEAWTNFFASWGDLSHIEVPVGSARRGTVRAE